MYIRRTLRKVTAKYKREYVQYNPKSFPTTQKQDHCSNNNITFSQKCRFVKEEDNVSCFMYKVTKTIQSQVTEIDWNFPMNRNYKRYTHKIILFYL